MFKPRTATFMMIGVVIVIMVGSVLVMLSPIDYAL